MNAYCKCSRSSAYYYSLYYRLPIFWVRVNIFFHPIIGRGTASSNSVRTKTIRGWKETFCRRTVRVNAIKCYLNLTLEKNWKEKEETLSIKGQVDTILVHLHEINGTNRHLQCQQCHQCPADMVDIHRHVMHQLVYGPVINKRKYHIIWFICKKIKLK